MQKNLNSKYFVKKFVNQIIIYEIGILNILFAGLKFKFTS